MIINLFCNEVEIKCQWVSSTFYLKGLQCRLLLVTETFNSNWLRIYNYIKSFQCKIGYIWHLLNFYKNERVLAKGGRFWYVAYILDFIKNCHHRRPFNVAATSTCLRQPLESIPKHFFGMMSNKSFSYFEIYL